MSGNGFICNDLGVTLTYPEKTYEATGLPSAELDITVHSYWKIAVNSPACDGRSVAINLSFGRLADMLDGIGKAVGEATVSAEDADVLAVALLRCRDSLIKAERI